MNWPLRASRISIRNPLRRLRRNGRAAASLTVTPATHDQPPSRATPGRRPSVPSVNTSQQPAKPAVPGVEVFSKKNRPEKYDLEDDDGELKFEARIDGTAVIRVFADCIFVETLDGKTVEVEEFEFSQPLPVGRVSTIELDQKDGRAEMILLERPWEGNNYQAVIRVSDPDKGDDQYGFDLEWER